MGAAGMKMLAVPSCRKAPFGIPGSLPGPARSNPRSGCRKISERIPTASHAPALHQASADQQMAIRVDTLLICPGAEYRFRQFHFSFSRVPLYQAKQPVGVDFWIHGFRIWLNQSAERRKAKNPCYAAPGACAIFRSGKYRRKSCSFKFIGPAGCRIRDDRKRRISPQGGNTSGRLSRFRLRKLP